MSMSKIFCIQCLANSYGCFCIMIDNIVGMTDRDHSQHNCQEQAECSYASRYQIHFEASILILSVCSI